MGGMEWMRWNRSEVEGSLNNTTGDDPEEHKSLHRRPQRNRNGTSKTRRKYVVTVSSGERADIKLKLI
jgi:hypothetical protein